MKLTEKSLKAIVTTANLGVLKTTTFGLRLDRGSKGYEVALVPRDGSIPPEILLQGGTASEAGACIDGVLATYKVFSDSMLGTTAKPEYATSSLFVKQAGERCPRTKCNSKDVTPGWIKIEQGTLKQLHRCEKCHLEWIAVYQLEDYELIMQHSESKP